MNTVAGDINHLRKLRRARRKLAETIYWTDDADWGTDVLRLALQDMDDTQVEIQVPCLICKRTFPEVYPVAQEPPAEPHAVLCGDCDEKILASMKENSEDD